MSCKKLHKKLIFFVEKELPEKERIKIQNHLLECPECAAFVKDLNKSFDILAKEKLPEINPFFFTRVKARLESQSNAEKVPFWQPIMIKFVQPTFFSLLLIAGIYTGFKIGTPSASIQISSSNSEQEMIPFLNEMQTEPIEGFLME